MKKLVAGILRQYGSSMEITHGEETVRLRAFFQPVRSKSWQTISNVASPLGEISRGQYVYMGPADVSVTQGDVLTVAGESYIFRKVEPYLYGDEKVYIWGLCVEKSVNDTWGNFSGEGVNGNWGSQS